jgi:hypothetical protein
VADPVALIGAARADEHPDAAVRARMVSPGGGAAYVDGHAGLRFGWLVGTVLVLLCGLLLGWANGATRLSTRRARIIGYLVSLAAPLLLLIGMVAIAW